MAEIKKALVLSGGGSRGSYEIGVWKALRECGFCPDIVTGVSVGALNGAMIVQDKFDESIRMWSELTTDMIMDVNISTEPDTKPSQLSAMSVFAREVIKNRGANTTPLRRLLEQLVDEKAVRSAPVEFGIITVSLSGLKPNALFVDEIEDGKLINYLLASSALYPAMQGQVIDDKVYIDGGFYDNVPIELAMNRGAEEIIVVDLHAVGLRRKVREDGLKITYIEPERDLGNILIFDKKNAEYNIAIGYLDGMKAFRKYEGVLYAFYPDGFWNRHDEVAARILSYSRELTGEIKLPGGIKMPDVSAVTLRNHLFRYINRYYKYKKLPKQSLGIPIMEIAGDIFKLDPKVCYTIGDFESAVMSAVRERGSEASFSELRELLRNDMPIWEKTEHARELARSLDRRDVCVWLSYELEKAVLEKNASARLFAAGVIFPAEFIAALYIITIKEDEL